jgi:hypothetical protein
MIEQPRRPSGVGSGSESRPTKRFSVVWVYILRSQRRASVVNPARGGVSDARWVKAREEVLGIIADNLSTAGWNWGYVSAIDSNGRTTWIADAHRGDGKRFVVHAEEKFTAFLELESVIRTAADRKIPALTNKAFILPCLIASP